MKPLRPFCKHTTSLNCCPLPACMLPFVSLLLAACCPGPGCLPRDPLRPVGLLITSQQPPTTLPEMTTEMTPEMCR
jgi:hypothetical protein